jgi:restriction system protein
MSLLLLRRGRIGRARVEADPPVFHLKSILEFGGNTPDGRLVHGVAVPWFEIMKMLQQDPQSMYQIGYERWEEIIAGAYKRAGFDEVILTPRSGDLGRDVIASIRGVGSIRIYDQVKAYSPGNLVTANDVRALLGVITGARNVSKGVITTTSEFAPGVATDPFLAPHMPFRLELKPREQLLKWLEELSSGSSSS